MDSFLPVIYFLQIFVFPLPVSGTVPWIAPLHSDDPATRPSKAKWEKIIEILFNLQFMAQTCEPGFRCTLEKCWNSGSAIHLTGLDKTNCTDLSGEFGRIKFGQAIGRQRKGQLCRWLVFSVTANKAALPLPRREFQHNRCNGISAASKGNILADLNVNSCVAWHF